MMNGWRGVLFDKDGTLIDFHGTWVPATVNTAAAMAVLALPDGGEHERAQLVRRLVGMIGYDYDARTLDPESLLARGSLGEIAALWARAAGLDGMEGAIERIGAEFRTHAVGSATPLAALGPFFERLRGRGMRLGVATMDTTLSPRMTFANLRVEHLLDFVTGFDGGHGEKPGPGMVQGFCRATGLRPAEVVVVGDSLHDLAMAKAAGAGLAVAVLSGVAGHEHLSADADHVIAGIDELEALLDRVHAPALA
ncbi:MAG: HAD family hydrolase [Alphaproteobacteria bacterium]|nr:HAD family hydrolase [Alphaproteobacteria bacterium]